MYPKKADYEDVDAYIDAIEDFFGFLKEEAEYNQPTHLFGHVACNSMRVGNKVNIDHGCYRGGRLTSVVVNPGGSLFFESVDSRQDKNEEGLQSFFVKRQNRFDFSKVGDKDLRRIDYFCDQGIPFIAGTMSPAEADQEAGDIESMARALDYYKAAGAEKVILQPKYMGSRCTLIINKEVEKSFATSRNGYPIEQHRLDLTDVFKQMREKFAYKFDDGVEVLILDSELMPWSALGKDLIDRDFRVAGSAVPEEIKILMETGFSNQFDQLMERFEDTEFGQEVHEGSKKDLVEKYGQNDFNNFRELVRLKKEYVSPEDESDMIEIYNEQIELYGSDQEVHVKPFMILKEVMSDGTEKTYFDGSNIEIFEEVSEDDYVVIDLSLEGALEDAEEFYGLITTEKKMEGVVIKPEKVYTPGIAPFVKVRNKNYLHIIYGHDYTAPAKLEALIKRKRVSRKRSVSLREFEIGMKMLKDIPFKDIGPNNEAYKIYIANMIAQEREERSIDPRL